MNPAPLLFLLLFSCSLSAQQALNIRTNNSCSYYGETITDKVYGFASSQEAQDVVKRITNAIGLEPKFELKAANVPNALATIQNNKRLILYSQNFIDKIKNATGTDWAGISILAHEIGHHLNGHTLEEDGSRPEIELEADKFSGFVLAKMGAGLNEAQAAAKNEANEKGSATHPPKSARMEAIAVGWNEGKPPKQQPVREEEKLRPPDVKKESVKIPDPSPSQTAATIQINYAGDQYNCQMPITFNVGGVSFTPSQNPFQMVNVPMGVQNYYISGNISCNYIGGCVARGQGQVIVKAGAVYNLTWQNTAYATCTVWLTPAN